jgi:hypothetical protein
VGKPYAKQYKVKSAIGLNICEPDRNESRTEFWVTGGGGDIRFTLEDQFKRVTPVAALPAAIPVVVPPAPLAPAPIPIPVEPVGHINGQLFWTVDAIVNHRTNRHRVVVQYQVRWPDKSTNWEPAQQVADDVPNGSSIADVIVSKHSFQCSINVFTMMSFQMSLCYH